MYDLREDGIFQRRQHQSLIHCHSRTSFGNSIPSLVVELQANLIQDLAEGEEECNVVASHPRRLVSPHESCEYLIVIQHVVLACVSLDFCRCLETFDSPLENRGVFDVTIYHLKRTFKVP